MQATYQQNTGHQELERILRFGWLNAAPQVEVEKYAVQLVRRVSRFQQESLAAIRDLSHKDITQISLVVRSILQIGYVELLQNDVNAAIIIEDLLQLVDKYDGDQSIAFVNGVLSAMQGQLQQRSG